MRIHHWKPGAEEQPICRQGCRGNLLLWRREERHSSEVSQTVQQALCTTSVPASHSTAHRLPQPFPSQTRTSFLLLQRERREQTKALSPVLSGNGEWENESEASTEIPLCNNWLTSPWKLYKVSFHSCLLLDGQVQAVRQECRKKLLALQTVSSPELILWSNSTSHKPALPCLSSFLPYCPGLCFVPWEQACSSSQAHASKDAGVLPTLSTV